MLSSVCEVFASLPCSTLGLDLNDAMWALEEMTLNGG